jgi:DNA repair exonuclease SbcCD ATPase subunit
MKYEPKIYIKAKQTQNNIYELQKAEEQKADEEKNKIYFKYRELERELNKKKYAEEQKADEEHKTQAEKLKNQRADADEQIKQFKRIIAFKDILKNEIELNKDDCKAYIYDYPRDKNGEVKRVLKDNCYCYPEKEKVYLKPIDILHEDKYLILKVFIGDNDKPKNKKTLFVLGDTILKFNHYESKVLTLPHEENAPIRKHIKDLPKEKELKVYYEKNKNKILKSFIEEHKKAVAELEEVRKNTDSKEWTILYLEHKKEMFENNYRRYEENEDYKKVVAELETLKGVY